MALFTRTSCTISYSVCTCGWLIFRPSEDDHNRTERKAILRAPIHISCVLGLNAGTILHLCMKSFSGVGGLAREGEIWPWTGFDFAESVYQKQRHLVFVPRPCEGVGPGGVRDWVTLSGGHKLRGPLNA